jgi:predicted methyltransferase
MPRWIAFATCLILTSAAAPFAAPSAHAATRGEEALTAAIDGDWRSAEDRARDAQRHPAASLNFWGLEPGMTILEIQPGGGAWWTQILAPYAKMTGGAYYATAADLDDPELSDRARASRDAFAERFAAQPDIYGTVGLVNWGTKSKPLPAGKFDFILTARSIHGWIMAGMVDKAFRDLYAALKPGGILAVEQHRANPGPQDPKAASGYVTEEYVIEHAKKAGFELAGRSEINANPRDTKDHPFGVWTLPPMGRTSPYGEPDDPSFDRTKYDAIGESDRMTLKFVKPR